MPPPVCSQILTLWRGSKLPRHNSIPYQNEVCLNSPQGLSGLASSV
ncbi:UNVERIFIED_ORG: hypothetical protein J2Y77_003511 [Pseudomonas lini]